MPTSYPVCGIDIATMPPADVVRHLVDRGTAGRPLAVHLCNAYTLSLVDRDQQLRAALEQSDLNLPDGAPVAWFGRRQGARGPVRGPDLFGEVVRSGVPVGARHYLYGGADGVADEVAASLRAHAEGVDVVGTETPPWTDLTPDQLQELARRVAESGATHLWIGLGTPRQDYLVHRITPHVDAVVVPVGAAFDFWAGTVRQAPAWMHGSGLEWLFRLFQEPRRLWRRYLVGNPRFLVNALRPRSRSRRR